MASSSNATSTQSTGSRLMGSVRSSSLMRFLHRTPPQFDKTTFVVDEVVQIPAKETGIIQIYQRVHDMQKAQHNDNEVVFRSSKTKMNADIVPVLDIQSNVSIDDVASELKWKRVKASEITSKHVRIMSTKLEAMFGPFITKPEGTIFEVANTYVTKVRVDNFVRLATVMPDGSTDQIYYFKPVHIYSPQNMAFQIHTTKTTCASNDFAVKGHCNEPVCKLRELKGTEKNVRLNSTRVIVQVAAKVTTPLAKARTVRLRFTYTIHERRRPKPESEQQLARDQTANNMKQ